MKARVKHGYYKEKDRIQKRLNRAEGQVRGIAGMVERDAYCIDILTQISAVRAALDKVAVELIRDHAKHCITHTADAGKQTKQANELANAISRMLPR